MCFSNIEWTILRKRNQNIKIPASSRQSLKNHPNQKWMHCFLLYTFSSGKKSWRHTASSALLGGQVWCVQSPQQSSPPSTGNWANFRHPLRSDPAEKSDGLFLSSNIQCFACHVCAGINFHHICWNDPRFGWYGVNIALEYTNDIWNWWSKFLILVMVIPPLGVFISGIKQPANYWVDEKKISKLQGTNGSLYPQHIWFQGIYKWHLELMLF